MRQQSICLFSKYFENGFVIDWQPVLGLLKLECHVCEVKFKLWSSSNTIHDNRIILIMSSSPKRRELLAPDHVVTKACVMTTC